MDIIGTDIKIIVDVKCVRDVNVGVATSYLGDTWMYISSPYSNFSLPNYSLTVSLPAVHYFCSEGIVCFQDNFPTVFLSGIRYGFKCYFYSSLCGNFVSIDIYHARYGV